MHNIAHFVSKKLNNFQEEGHPDTFPLGRGKPHPQTAPPRGLRPLGWRPPPDFTYVLFTPLHGVPQILYCLLSQKSTSVMH